MYYLVYELLIFLFCFFSTKIRRLLVLMILKKIVFKVLLSKIPI